ncbi:MAG TPA: hypothetical protein ENN47_00645 [Mesotoga infera]|uniref:WD40 repeat domain-containing protein n=1 Tax=Mesotoga infera TaxID=1236046 RepID=A0A7C1GRL2_9BACT|nr:hypothetical protein [Mesotoga infera]
MRKAIPLIIVLFAAAFLCASAFHFGYGFNGLLEVSVEDQEWRVRIIPVTSLSSGGVAAGGIVFNVLGDKGFAILSALQPENYRIVDTFHCEAIDVNIERLEVFVADGTHGLEIFKFFGLNFYKHVQTIPMKGWISTVSYIDDYVFAGSELDGLFIVRRGENGFELVDHILPRYINDIETGITVNAISASQYSFYVAAGDRGVLVFEKDGFTLRQKSEIPVSYAMDVAVLDGEVFVADSRERKIKIFCEADCILKESYSTDSTPRELVPVNDWQHNRKMILCRFDDSISVFSRDNFQELFSLRGTFFGIVEPRYLFN